MTILHIPHASTKIPAGVTPYLVSPADLAAQQLALVDHFTDELYDLPGADRVVFPVSRFFIDAERFPDDAHEPMSMIGMGVFYTRTTSLTPLRENPPRALRDALLNDYYWPHHKDLETRVMNALARDGKALIIDCHSYPEKPLPYEGDKARLPRPQIGIGTDDFHTPASLSDLASRLFREKGYEVNINVPFAGTLTPLSVYRRDPRVHSIMIEVRRDLYMDEKTGLKHSGFARVQADLTAVMRALDAL